MPIAISCRRKLKLGELLGVPLGEPLAELLGELLGVSLAEGRDALPDVRRDGLPDVPLG